MPCFARTLNGTWVEGTGNSINYSYRVHDPRLGRFLSIDPLAPKYAYNSPYAFSENRVTDGVELEGLEVFFGWFEVLTFGKADLALVDAETAAALSRAGTAAAESGAATPKPSTGGGASRMTDIQPMPGRAAGRTTDANPTTGGNTPWTVPNPFNGSDNNSGKNSDKGKLSGMGRNISRMSDEKKEEVYTLYITRRDRKKDMGLVSTDLLYIGMFKGTDENVRYSPKDIEHINMTKLGQGNYDEIKGAEQQLIELNNGGNPYPKTSLDIDNINNSLNPTRRDLLYAPRMQKGKDWLDKHNSNWKSDYHHSNNPVPPHGTTP